MPNNEDTMLDLDGLSHFLLLLKDIFPLISAVPTKVSDLTNDSGFSANVIETVKVNGSALTPDGNKAVDVTVPSYSPATTSANGLMSKEDKSKLDGIDASADVNVIETVKVNGSALTPDANKAVSISVPTKVSDITNDSGYQTASDVATAIAGITGLSFEIVQTLPSTGSAGKIYLISNSGTSTNVYDEYIYYNNAWEMLGTTAVDLSGYYNTSNLRAITNAEIDALFE